MNAPWLRELEDAIELTLHVQPGAKRTEVVGSHGDAMKVRLAAAAIEGNANEELVRFLADQFGVPRRAVTILRGALSRHKVVRVKMPVRRVDRDWNALRGVDRS